MRILWLLMLLCSVLCSVEKEEYEGPPDISATEGEPSSIVNNCVCAISGELFLHERDVALTGGEPLIIDRSYSNFQTNASLGLWGLDYIEEITISDVKLFRNDEDDGKNADKLSLIRHTGARIDYLHPQSKKDKKKSKIRFDLCVPPGLTNTGSRISGQMNIRNQEVHYHPEDERVTVKMGNGCLKTFKKVSKHDKDGWRLEKEEKGNGNLVYHIQDGGLKFQTKSKSKAGLVFNEFSYRQSNDGKEVETCTFQFPDGNEMKYFFKKKKYKLKTEKNQPTSYLYVPYLYKVENPYRATEKYEYEDKDQVKDLQLVSRHFGEGRYQEIEYYKKGKNHVHGEIEIKKEDDYRINRVKKLKAPVGYDHRSVVTHQFIYDGKVEKTKRGKKRLGAGKTQAFDAYDRLTLYKYDDQQRLTHLSRCEGSTLDTLYSTEVFSWGTRGELLCKSLRDSHKTSYYAKTYTYDERGNVTRTRLYGKLTGKPCPPIEVNDSNINDNGCEYEETTNTYSNDGFNLLQSETTGDKTTKYVYFANTDLLGEKHLVYRNEVKLREFYAYDEHGMLVEKINDDGHTYGRYDLTGVTERHITRIKNRQTLPAGIPEEISEYYLDQGTEKLLRRAVCHYSPRGELIKQEVFDEKGQFAFAQSWKYDAHGNVIAETDPLGQKTERTYDIHNNLLSEKKPGFPLVKNTYDYMNRLISKEEIHDDGRHLTTLYRYDYLGNQVASIDPYGQETNVQFDAFNRPILLEKPAVSFAGSLTRPKEATEYDIAGHKIGQIDPNGCKTSSEYNIRGQPTLRTYPDGTQERWIYDIHGYLVEKTAKNGTFIRYERDFLGRATQETLFSREGAFLSQTRKEYNAFQLLKSVDEEGLETRYIYDGAGRLIEKQCGDKREYISYDDLGRVSEIKTEDSLLSKKYDFLNRIIEERQDHYLTRYEYDERGNKILIEDGGILTTNHYDSSNRKTQVTNGKGESAHVHYNENYINEYGQRVLQITITDPLGYNLIETYDTLGRITESKRFNPVGILVSSLKKNYDLSGNPIQEIVLQSKEKEIIHEMHYKNQQLVLSIEALNTPEEKRTYTEYNIYGEKSAVVKPDGTRLNFEYDSLGKLKKLSSYDLSYDYTTDRLGNITSVIDHLGHLSQRRYDAYHRLTEDILPNGLSLKYTYDLLDRVQKLTYPDGSQLEYLYEKNSLKEVKRIQEGHCIYSHRITQRSLNNQVEKVIFASGQEGTYARDILGRVTQIHTPWFEQTIPNDGYDAGGHLKTFDNNHTPSSFEYDDCGAIKKEQGMFTHQYQFDALANRISMDGEQSHVNSLNQLIKKGDHTLTYDRNGNLTQQENTQYIYDSLDRLIYVKKGDQEIRYEYDAFHHRLKKIHNSQETLFFYQGEEEIGSYINNQCISLKLLSTDNTLPSIALELNHVPYIPIYDLFSNICVLVDFQGNTHRIHYSAFGERDTSQFPSPWQYSGKRYDEDTQLLSFSFRDFDPKLGRWITPDPSGYIDGANLYAFVHNNPLRYKDSLGLFSLEMPDFNFFGNSQVSTFEFDKFFASDLTMEQHFNRSWEDFDCLSCYTERTSTFTINPQNSLPYNPNIMCTYNNGMLTNLKECRDNAGYLAELANCPIEVVHTPTYGLFVDSLRYGLARLNMGTETVTAMTKGWAAYLEKNPEGHILQICHSRAAADTRKALELCTEEQRQHIEVIAVAPSCFIDEELCGRITHILSKGDYVYYADPIGMVRCRDTIVYVPAAEGSWLNSHSIQSPVYEQKLKDSYKDFYKRHSK